MAPPREPVYAKDEKVLCFHHELLYEAKVLDSKLSDPSDKKSALQYRVHYKGWKNTWDDWVPQDRLRKLNEENKQLAQNLKSEMDDQNVRVATKSASKKKKTAGSDVGSTRGSEDRQSLPPIGRGQKRGRDNEIEKVSKENPIPKPALEPMDPPISGKSGSTPYATAPRRSARIAKPTEKAVSAQLLGPSARKSKTSSQNKSSTIAAQPVDQTPAEASIQPAEQWSVAEPSKVEPRAASTTPPKPSSQIPGDGTLQTSLDLNASPQSTPKKRKAAGDSDESPPHKKPSQSPRTENGQSSSRQDSSPIASETPAVSPSSRKRKASTSPTDEPALKKREQAAGSAIASATALPSSEVNTWTEASGFSAPESFERGTPIKKPDVTAGQRKKVTFLEPNDQTPISTQKKQPRKNALPPMQAAPQRKSKETGHEIQRASPLPAQQVSSSAIPTSSREQPPAAESLPSIDEDFWAKEANEVKDYMNRPPLFQPSSGTDYYNERFLTSNGIDWRRTTLAAILDDSADPKVAPSSPVLPAVENRPERETACPEEQKPEGSSSPLSDAPSSPLLDLTGQTIEAAPAQTQPAQATKLNKQASNRRSLRAGKSQKAAVAGVRKSNRAKGKAPAPIPTKTSKKPYRIYADEELEGDNLDHIGDILRKKKKKVLGSGTHAPIETPARGIKRHRKWEHVHRTDPGNFAKLLFYSELDNHEHPVIAGYPPEAPPEDMMKNHKIKKQIIEDKVENANNDNEQEEHFQARPAVKIDVPDHLKAILVDDWENVTKNLSLLPVPAEHSVSEILSTYFDEEKGKRRLGSAEADLLEEVVQGMKEYFEKCLGKMLLYRFEREQYFQVRQAMEKEDPIYKDKVIADVYGAEHLCRLFVSLPELIAQTNMDAQSVSKLRQEVMEMASWLGKNSARFFTANYESASAEYIEKVRGI